MEFEDLFKSKIELMNENNNLKTKLKDMEIELKKEKLNAINWETVAKSLLDNSKGVGGKFPKEEKIMEISIDKKGLITLTVNNEIRRVSSILFKASIDEIPTLITEEYIYPNDEKSSNNNKKNSNK